VRSPASPRFSPASPAFSCVQHPPPLEWARLTISSRIVVKADVASVQPNFAGVLSDESAHEPDLAWLLSREPEIQVRRGNCLVHCAHSSSKADAVTAPPLARRRLSFLPRRPRTGELLVAASSSSSNGLTCPFLHSQPDLARVFARESVWRRRRRHPVDQPDDGAVDPAAVAHLLERTVVVAVSGTRTVEEAAFVGRSQSPLGAGRSRSSVALATSSRLRLSPRFGRSGTVEVRARARGSASVDVRATDRLARALSRVCVGRIKQLELPCSWRAQSARGGEGGGRNASVPPYRRSHRSLRPTLTAFAYIWNASGSFETTREGCRCLLGKGCASALRRGRVSASPFTGGQSPFTGAQSPFGAGAAGYSLLSPSLLSGSSRRWRSARGACARFRSGVRLCSSSSNSSQLPAESLIQCLRRCSSPPNSLSLDCAACGRRGSFGSCSPGARCPKLAPACYRRSVFLR